MGSPVKRNSIRKPLARAYYSTMYSYNLTDEELNDLIKDAVRN